MRNFRFTALCVKYFVRYALHTPNPPEVMTLQEQNKALLGLTVEIVSAHVKNNQVPAADLPRLIEQVYGALRLAGAPKRAPAPVAEKPDPEPRTAPVVPIRKSVFAEYIICLEDGRKLKTLKRHLRSTYNMTPEQYRDKWDLPHDYPMVAPNYAEHRSALAKQSGLGRKSAASKAAAPEPDSAPAAAPAEAPPPLPDQPVDAQAPETRRRVEHTAASVFAGFPGRSRSGEEDGEDVTRPEPEPRKPRRKPFSKQLARNMRR